MRTIYPRPDVHIASIDRSSIRKFAVEECVYLKQAIMDGASGHEVAQDRTMQISKFAATLCPVDQDLFYELYAEETDRLLHSDE